MDELDLERPDIEACARTHLAQLRDFQQTVLLELGAHQRQGKGRTVNGSVDLIKHDQVVVVFEHHHVHPEFAEATEGKGPKLTADRGNGNASLRESSS